MRSLLLSLLLTGLAVGPIRGQQWHRAADLDLITRAIARRTERDADTLLASWRAEAHGFVRYASVLDHGDGPVERVIRADELRVEVYGEAPNRSKQFIHAWRDTSFVPNRIVYHRDHLGIVANDFGATIRLGQGEEVRDVPHPLSALGAPSYLFAISDTLTIAGPAGTVHVVGVDVRPVDADSAGTIGTLYIDRDRAALVRFTFTFTPASYRDRTVEDITVTLENTLQLNARWLPWKQSIVIRRATPLLDLPFHTVLRADWTLDGYQLGASQPPRGYTGPYIEGPVRPFPGTWDAPLMHGLVLLPATDADVEDVKQQASMALNGNALSGMPAVRLLGNGLSDFLRVNRAQGVVPGFGATWSVTRTLRAAGHLGYGISDHLVTADASLVTQHGRVQVGLEGGRSVRDISDVPPTSGVSNSIGTLVDGEDYGDYVELDRALASARTVISGLHLQLQAGVERSRSLATTFRPISASADSNPALGAGTAAIIRATVGDHDLHGYGWQLDLEHGTGDATWGRAAAHIALHFALPKGELRLASYAGTATVGLPAYREFVLGGRGTLLGVPFREFGGRTMGWMDLSLALPAAVPTPRFPYSRYVRLPSTIAPFIAVGAAGDPMAALPWTATHGVESVAGIRLDAWGPLFRLEGGVSLRTGRIGVSFDVHPDWWALM